VKATSLSLGAAALSLVALAGCGAGKAANVDAGPPLLAGRRSFDAVATLGLGGAVKPSTNLPDTVAFTLVIDADQHRAVAGGHGLASVVTTTSADGRHFSVPEFSVGLPASGACDASASTIVFHSLDVVVADTTLSGQAMGAARVSCGDCQFDVPFSGAVTGGADATAPLLFPVTIPDNPLQAFGVAASEPLPKTAIARLVGGDGSSIELDPMVTPGDIPVIASFTKPDVVLAPGVGYAVAFDGLVDFAGLHGSADTLRLAQFPEIPLIPADGFESVTTAEVGGATVISDGPLPPISGAHSVYFGAQGAPAPTAAAVGGSLRVRLAVPAGATKLAFSYQMVGQYAGSGFGGTISYGSVGHAPASGDFTTTPAGTQTTWPDGRIVYVTDPATKELALPADVTNELVVVFEPFGFGCGGPMPPAGGMLLDDLRVE
jgi:hypothetical protein